MHSPRECIDFPVDLPARGLDLVLLLCEHPSELAILRRAHEQKTAQQHAEHEHGRGDQQRTAADREQRARLRQVDVASAAGAARNDLEMHVDF
jgi:hypothetical protein